RRRSGPLPAISSRLGLRPENKVCRADRAASLELQPSAISPGLREARQEAQGSVLARMAVHQGRGVLVNQHEMAGHPQVGLQIGRRLVSTQVAYIERYRDRLSNRQPVRRN